MDIIAAIIQRLSELPVQTTLTAFVVLILGVSIVWGILKWLFNMAWRTFWTVLFVVVALLGCGLVLTLLTRAG